MGVLFTAFLGVLFSTAGVTGSPERRVAEPADLVFERAEAEAAVKTEVLQIALGDEDYEFDVDLEAARSRSTARRERSARPCK